MKITDLMPDKENARRHNSRNVGMIVDALREVGAARSIVIDEDGLILAGNATVEAAAQAGIERVHVVDADGETIVAVRRKGLTAEAKKRLALFDNRSAELAEWNPDQLLADLEGGLDLSGLFGKDEFDKLLAELTIKEEEPEPDRILYVPDIIFPSANEWGIPTLDVSLQADFLELPITRWGEIGRKSKMRGTYHFYTEDYKFDALWKNPLNLINSQCSTIVEPNFSTNPLMPMAVGLWAIYRKRWLARYVQSYGVKVWVDLCVAAKFRELNLLGVPQGWQSYATRALDHQLEDVKVDYEAALKHAGTKPNFLVYGGGSASENLCKERAWNHLPENMHVKDGRKIADYG